MTIRIALLDSGIAAHHAHIQDRRGQVEFLGDCTRLDPGLPGVPHPDEMGHGTAVAAAILDLCPGATLLSVRIFDRRPEATPEILVRALRIALTGEPAIVNLSLGSPDARVVEAFGESLLEAQSRGVLVIAPAEYRGFPSWPGGLEGVQGVLVDPLLPRDAPERHEEGGRTWWHASPYPRDIPGVPRERNFFGPSFACANVTGFLARTRSGPQPW